MDDVQVHAATDFHDAQLAQVGTAERLIRGASVDKVQKITNFEGQSDSTVHSPLCPFWQWSVRIKRQKMTYLTNDHAPTSAKDVDPRS